MIGAIEPAAAALTDAERDLATAGQLQRMLLPPSPFTSNSWQAVHHYQPAGVISGDYVDLVSRSDRLYFMLGDVSGKGVVAALLMAQLHAMFRSLIPFQLSMEELIGRASKLLCASSLPAQYATLVFGHVAEDGEVLIANAGHPPPLVIGADRQSDVKATGLPVGLFCQAQFSSTQLRLGDNETLLIYTDGLTEAENAQGQEYGVERLAAVARAAAADSTERLVTAVVADQAAFRGPVANRDDLALLALRRR